MKTSYYLLMLFFLCGCTTEKRQNVKYISAAYELLNEEIVTTMPGPLRVAGEFLAWEDPFARDYFVYVHNKNIGHCMGAMGKVGEGPREFGSYPIPQVTEHLGGTVICNKERGVLANACSKFPNLSLYKNDGDGFSLACDYKSDGSEYEVRGD